MGCQLSQNEDDSREKAPMESTVAAIAVATEATASTTANTNVNYKSRLEWKMCIVSYCVAPTLLLVNFKNQSKFYLPGKRYTGTWIRFVRLHVKRSAIRSLCAVPCFTQRTFMFEQQSIALVKWWWRFEWITTIANHWLEFKSIHKTTRRSACTAKSQGK